MWSFSAHTHVPGQLLFMQLTGRREFIALLSEFPTVSLNLGLEINARNSLSKRAYDRRKRAGREFAS